MDESDVTIIGYVPGPGMEFRFRVGRYRWRLDGSRTALLARWGRRWLRLAYAADEPRAHWYVGHWPRGRAESRALTDDETALCVITLGCTLNRTLHGCRTVPRADRLITAT